jgi:hypothetical protein
MLRLVLLLAYVILSLSSPHADQGGGIDPLGPPQSIDGGGGIDPLG